ncbi:hypothetical protein BGZ74_002512 [Mortierella antarctica]|nr:hypothetical protein BGZ74_002512 [Mortierella antarctica]
MDDHPRHHQDANPETIPMAELVDPPRTSKCFTLSAIVLFLAFVASSVPNVLSPQPRNTTSVAKASSVVPSPIVTHSPGQLQQLLQQAFHTKSIVYPSPVSPPSQAIDGLSPKHPQSTETPPPQQQQHEQQQQQQQREHLIEKTTVLELVLIVVNVSFRVVFWALSLVYRSIRYVVIQPAGIIMRLLETPLEMMHEIYKTVMPVYSFFTVAAIIGVVVGGSATWIAQLVISALGADQDKRPVPPPTLVAVPPRQRTTSSSSSSASQSPPSRPRRAAQGQVQDQGRKKEYAQANNIASKVASSGGQIVYHGQGQDLVQPRRTRRAPSEYDYDDDDDDDDSDWAA